MPRPSRALWVLLFAGCGSMPQGDLDGAADDASALQETNGQDALEDTSGDAPEVTPDALPSDARDSQAPPDSPDAPGDRTAADGRVDARSDARMDATSEPRTDATMDVRDVVTDAMDGLSGDIITDIIMDTPSDMRCPEGMVLVNGAVCVDRWEASLEEVLPDGAARPWSPYLSVEGRTVRALSRGGVVPQGYISGQQAEAACRLAGKRLCALSEWLQACRGPMTLTYPYGNTYERRRCNEARTPHPVVQFYGTSMGVFTYERMNNPGINMQPDSLARTGAFDRCVSPWGLFDLVGNLHEWIADPAGTFKGGFYVDAEINGRGCLYTTTAHAFTYHDYSTGFRCCANPR